MKLLLKYLSFGNTVWQKIYPRFTCGVTQLWYYSVTVSNSHLPRALTGQDLQSGVKDSHIKMVGTSFAHSALSFTESLTAGKFPVKLKRERTASQTMDLAPTFPRTTEKKQIVAGPCFFVCILPNFVTLQSDFHSQELFTSCLSRPKISTQQRKLTLPLPPAGRNSAEKQNQSFQNRLLMLYTLSQGNTRLTVQKS